MTLRHLPAYLKERFPVPAYSVLVALFFASAVAVAHNLGGGERTWWGGALAVLLVFFHLRVFDEHKDHESDAAAYPERVLSRGLITLRDLRWLGIGAIVAEGLLVGVAGLRGVAVWFATLVFTLLMFKEFFVGAWLEKRLVLYAITHNPVVAGLALLGWACTDAAWDARYLWYLGAVSLGSLAFELGRKMRLPAEEIPGVPSYTSVLGRGRALALIWGTLLGTSSCTAMVLREGGRLAAWVDLSVAPYVLALVPLLPAAAMILPASKAKKVEGGATLALLLTLLIIGVWTWP